MFHVVVAWSSNGYAGSGVVGRTTVVGSWTLRVVVIKYMPFEVRVVRIRLAVYHPGSLYILVLAVVMYSIGPKFVFFHVGP
jgi:hypothetical protein